MQSHLAGQFGTKTVRVWLGDCLFRNGGSSNISLVALERILRQPLKKVCFLIMGPDSIWNPVPLENMFLKKSFDFLNRLMNKTWNSFKCRAILRINLELKTCTYVLVNNRFDPVDQAILAWSP